MYDNADRLGLNINAYFAAVFERYSQSKDVSALIADPCFSEDDVDLYLDFAIFIARNHGERAAIDYCDRLRGYFLRQNRDELVAKVLVIQAQLFDDLGVGMSRDLYALEAAEAFAMFGQYPAAEKALAMVKA
ncbi:hypothetical protein [Agrobacterium cavarae]|uniref:hypothetical protein n=1 Tax=Agrobacterium cavarae TaxID=2528239 RepID=UPI0028AD788D|nr:hypothetical protein [Agrobacterium cavarae]